MQSIQDRSFEFAVRIVRLHDYLCTKKGAARVIARQLLNSGTSVGANLEEATAAQSKPAYLHICEGATRLSDGRADSTSGKLVSYLVSDFVKGMTPNS